MSQTIDQRVVEMKFNNSQFESGVKTSLGTLDKLKNSLNLGEASKGLDKLKESTKGFSVASVTDGVNTLSLRFNALGVAGAAIISDLAVTMTHKLGGAIKNTIGLISSGGMRRAMNLEQARFSMRGLLEATEKMADGSEKKILKYGITVEDIMGPNGPVQKSVQGTAYGLDESAKAASNFIASGITDLDDLEQALSSISGTAAQTGGSFEEISHIYQRVAGQGRVYATDLNSIAARGVNATVAIRDYINNLNGDFSGLSDKFKEVAGKMGKTIDFTEQDIREMVSAGAIQFDVFSKAMFAAFGENAYRANETFSGSLSNMKAALSRFGAKFATPYLENMRDIFNALRPMIDTISKVLDPLVNKINSLFKSLTQFSIGKINGINDFFKSLVPVEKESIEVREGLIKTEEALTKLDKMNIKSSAPIQRLAAALGNLVNASLKIGSAINNLLAPAFGKLVSFFPKINVDSIVGLSESFLSLSERFEKFTSSSSSIKTVINPLVNIADVIGKLFVLAASGAKAFITNMSPLILILGKAVYVLQVITNVFARFISKIIDIVSYNDLLNLSFKTLSNLLSGIFGPIIDAIYEKFNKLDSALNISKKLDPVIDAFSQFATKLKDFLSVDRDFSFIGEGIVSGTLKIGEVFKKLVSYILPVESGFKKLTDRISEFNSSVSIKSTGIGFLDTLSKILTVIAPIVSKAASVIGSSLLKIGKSITENFSFTDLIKLFMSFKIGEVAASMGILYKQLKLIFSTISGFAGAKLAAIKSFATSLVMLSAALLVLSLIDYPKLIAATSVLHILLLEMKTFLSFVGELGGTFNPKQILQIASLARALLPLAASMLILTIALKTLASLELSKLVQGLGGISAMIIMLSMYTEFMANLSKQGGEVMKSAGMLIGLAVAINLLAIAVKKLGTMDFNTMAQGLIGIGGLLLALGLFTKFSYVDMMSASSGVALIGLAIAINLLSVAVKKLGEMDPGKMAQGLLAIGFALSELVIALNLLDSERIAAKAASMLIAAGAILIIAHSMSMLAKIDTNGIVTGLMGIGLSLAIVVASLNSMPKAGAASAAGAMILMATGILILSGALKVLSTIPMSSMLTALLGISGSLLIFGVAAMALAPLGPALLLVAASMVALGAGVLFLATGIAILAPSLLAFTVALVESTKMLIDNVDTITTGAMIAITSVITSILESLKLTASLLFETVGVMLDGLFNLIIEKTPMFMETIRVWFTGLLELLQEMSPIIMETIGVFIESILTLIVETVPKFIETLGVLLDSFLEFIIEYIPKMVEAGLQILLGILEGIANNIQLIIEAGADIVINLLNGISNKIPDVIDSAFNLVISFINGLANAVRSRSYEIGQAGWNLASALIQGVVNGIAGFFSEPVKKIKELGSSILKGIKEKISFKKFKELGRDIIDGLKKGISSLADSAVETVKGLGSSLLGGLKSILGINSPSKETKDIGKYIVEGLNSGIDSNESSALGTISSFASNVLDKLKNGLTDKKSRSSGASVIQGLINGINSKLKDVDNKTNSIVSSITTKIQQGLASTKTITYGVSAISGIESGLNSKISSVKSVSEKISKTVKAGFTDTLTFSSFQDIALNIMRGLENGINIRKPQAINAAKNAARDVIDVTKRIYQEKSPSRVFAEIGGFLMQGLGIGIDDYKKEPINTIKSVGNTINNSLAHILDSDNSPVITPVLDLSEIQNGASDINGMFGNSSIGNVAANVQLSSSNSITSAFDRLSALISGMPEDLIDTNKVYEAVRDGASNAVFNVMLDGERLTNVVTNVMNSQMQRDISFLGG